MNYWSLLLSDYSATEPNSEATDSDLDDDTWTPTKDTYEEGEGYSHGSEAGTESDTKMKLKTKN
ncbi:hypothetical protein D3C87_1806740 [compost metagenome]